MGSTPDRSYVSRGNRDRKIQGSGGSAGASGLRSAERKGGELPSKAPNDADGLGTSTIELVRVRSERAERGRDGGEGGWI